MTHDIKSKLQEFAQANGIFTNQGSNGLFYSWHHWSCEWDYLGNQADPFGEGVDELESVINICQVKGIKIPQWMAIAEAAL